jgi:hypothetical protein
MTRDTSLTWPYARAAWAIHKAGNSPSPVDGGIKVGTIPGGYAGDEGKGASHAHIRFRIVESHAEVIDAQVAMGVLA